MFDGVLHPGFLFFNTLPNYCHDYCNATPPMSTGLMGLFHKFIFHMKDSTFYVRFRVRFFCYVPLVIFSKKKLFTLDENETTKKHLACVRREAMLESF